MELVGMGEVSCIAIVSVRRHAEPLPNRCVAGVHCVIHT